MSCQFPISRSLAARRWHLLRCPDCRMAQAADATLDRGLQRLKAEQAPEEGLAYTLAAVGIVPAARAPRRRWRASISRSLMAAGAASALLAAGWLYSIDINPQITIPTPTMPSPNAFDFFLKAGIPENQQQEIDAALDTKPHKILLENGRPQMDERGVIVNADRMSTPGSYSSSSSTSYKNGQAPLETETLNTKAGKLVRHYVIRTYSVAEKEAVLRAYASSLALVRKGLNYAYLAPPLRSPQASLSYFPRDRALARLLELEAQVREGHGDLNGAVNSRLDAMQLGAMIPRGSVIIGKLVGISCEAIGRHSLWNLVDRLNATQARAAARRMEHIVQLHVPIADTLQEEKWSDQAVLMSVFRERRWRVGFTRDMGTGASMQNWSAPIANIVSYAKLLPYSKRKIMNDWTDYMDWHIRDACLPYCSRQANADAAEKEILRECDDPLTEIFAPVFTQAAFLDVATCEVQDELLMTMLALRAYQQEHGAYPGTLAALVPGYLTAIPQDPFIGSQPLGYRRTGDKFVLYSVGPDGKDDHGAPIDNDLAVWPNTPGAGRLTEAAKRKLSLKMRLIHNPKGLTSKDLTEESEWKRYGIKSDSKGDIVAGTNIRLGSN